MSSRLSWDIVKHYTERNKFGFTFREVVNDFTEKHPVHLSGILADMVDRGMLYKITRNTYHIIPINADPLSYVPDELQVAKYVMQDKEYYLGYATALKIHGLSDHPEGKLTEDSNSNGKVAEDSNSNDKVDKDKDNTGVQAENKVYVVTKFQMNPSNRNYRGIECQFIHHDEFRFFGFNDKWINEIEKARVSDLERTVVDILSKPQYCGGIAEVGKAIFNARDQIENDKLFYYFSKNHFKSAKKRFLFITELLGLDWTERHDQMMDDIGSGISILDPTAPVQGRSQSKFRLKINVDPSHITKEIFH